MKDKFLRLTRQVISDMFDECNRLYFNSEVSPPKKIELWTPNRKTLGMVRPVYAGKGEKPFSYLHISKRYKWTAGNLKKVVVHEMIHLYIEDYLRPLRWWERWFPFLITGHDEEFYKVMNDLNNQYDLDIKVRFKEMKPYFIK